jgi:hypothetical protein
MSNALRFLHLAPTPQDRVPYKTPPPLLLFSLPLQDPASLAPSRPARAAAGGEGGLTRGGRALGAVGDAVHGAGAAAGGARQVAPPVAARAHGGGRDTCVQLEREDVTRVYNSKERT